ncbi:hypothetical protein JYT89_00275 [Flavobacteriaceae bacterium AH-315-B10]|nr:hypothetical protein [Flavobacteriaceae bacterium AH-315-B10]
MKNISSNYYLFFMLIMSCFLNKTLSAQSYIGPALDNYAGVYGIVVNPASVVDSPFKADINLVSASAFAGSDYFGIDLNSVISSDGGFDFEDVADKFPEDDNNFFFNADVLGPSFMFNLNEKSSIGITTRVRAYLNINNINGELYESLADDGFDEAEDYDFNMKDFKGTIHAWAEIGLTYGRILVKDEKRLLKGGITLKYLQGAGAAFFNP